MSNHRRRINLEHVENFHFLRLRHKTLRFSHVLLSRLIQKSPPLSSHACAKDEAEHRPAPVLAESPCTWMSQSVCVHVKACYRRQCCNAHATRISLAESASRMVIFVRLSSFMVEIYTNLYWEFSYICADYSAINLLNYQIIYWCACIARVTIVRNLNKQNGKFYSV